MSVSLNKIEVTLTTFLNELQRFQNVTEDKGKEVEVNVANIEKEYMRGLSFKNKVGTSQMKKNGKGRTLNNSDRKKVVKGICYHYN